MMEDRIAKLETSHLLNTARLDRIEGDLRDVGTGVKTLLERDARRPEALSWAKVAGTAITTLTILGGLAWLVGAAVEHSAAVVSLKERMDHAEWKYGWTGRIDK